MAANGRLIDTNATSDCPVAIVASKLHHCGLLAESPMAMASSSTTTSSTYAVGQLWRCRGRSAAETPLLLINQIDTHPQGGQILHVTISDIQVRHAGMPNGTLDTLPHIPVIAQTLERSAAEYVGVSAPNQAYLPGYAEWKAAFDAGRAGSFGIAVSEILDIVEGQLAKRG
ncbi:hypothetical protein XcfCFBP6990P_05595 [Xanthomonas citri pv. phaseoli var. fuscans]|nr:hypothetical protein XcfCFBP6988P_08720 [Xanthomonas citri pv. phaseoli var. fuscans]ATS45022.1 hypothetical protein XcfCFBP6989P_11755 [Xanthomonas citri pv. phaseoli var. fuscans]ATS49218.1 hypothetical protein XcfCFBP6990P_05595 [Xanthomonas citri pv. phaseoli var. fuscans]ATS86504.1 hypothetical protein XcfCFBP6991P_05865 [Xanthomonas citri pv. phaseoli var. fuscans]QWN22682.1 hypothetical protein DGM98_06590 [Xanthomonas citri]